MIRIREATQEDNEGLQRLQAQCPQGTSLVVSTVNTPDFFARVKAYADYRVYKAEENGRIIASAACALRTAMVNGHMVKVGHLFQTFVHPDFRGRRIAGLLLVTREEYLKQRGAVLAYALIMEGNSPSMQHAERHHYRRHNTLVMPGIAVTKETDLNSFGNIRRISTEDLAAVTKLLNETWGNCELYEPLSPETLLQFIERTPAYDLQNLFVLEEGGEIVACLGYWDWSRVTKIRVEKLNLKMRLAGIAANLTSHFASLPHAPQPGNLLKQIVLTPIGFQNARQLAVLLRYINNIALIQDIGYIYFICQRKHPMITALKGFFHIDTALHLYIKPLHENVALGERPVFISGIDL